MSDTICEVRTLFDQAKRLFAAPRDAEDDRDLVAKVHARSAERSEALEVDVDSDKPLPAAVPASDEQERWLTENREALQLERARGAERVAVGSVPKR